MRIFQSTLALVFALLLVASLSMGVLSQTGQTAPPPTPPSQGTAAPQQQAPVYETATVLKAITRLVVVDVVATNGKGEAITNLTKEDFTLLEDGKPQGIRTFSLQQAAPEKGQNPGALPALPDNITTNIPRYNVNNALNIILIDALNTTTLNQAYARDEMIKYLRTIPEGQPVAVYSLGRKLTLLQDFTSDPSILKKAAQNLKMEASRLKDNPSGGPPPQLLPTGFVDAGLIPQQLVQQMERFQNEDTANMTDERVRLTLTALGALARALAGYPGRKNLLWISEGFPLDINPDLSLGVSTDRHYSPDIARVADSLIDAQVAVYPIDARGLAGPSAFDAQNSGVDQFGRSTGANGGRLASTISKDSDALMSAHATMQEVAEKTGGRAFYNRNDIDGAIRNSIADGSTYYTLAYYPENKDWNGKFRRIQLKTSRSGIKLRYRLGYYAVDPKSFASQTEKMQLQLFNQAMDIDFPISTGLQFRAAIIQPSEKTGNKVLLRFAIDPHALSFDNPPDGVRHATVECGAAIYSDTGKPMNMTVNTFKAELKPDLYARVMKGSLPCQQALELKPGKYLLRMGVRDSQTGLIGTSNARLTIGAASAAVAAPAQEKKP
jgi:VWFA-related protein